MKRRDETYIGAEMNGNYDSTPQFSISVNVLNKQILCLILSLD